MKPAGVFRVALALLVLLCPLNLAMAQAHFLPATDARLRSDVLILVDEGVIDLPANTWPLPAADVSRAVATVKVDNLGEPALQMALLRVQAKVAVNDDTSEWRARELRVFAGQPSQLRVYGTTAREELEIQSVGGTTNDRWSLTLSATGVASPEDDHHLRLDGSNLSIRWGNWLFSVNQQERWWGPGWDGSLILSTNARPMPGVSLDRMRSGQSELPILRWFGPWRFNAFLGRAERYRPDVDESLFLGMRLSFKPAQILEFGLSRTAQFCGRHRPCDFTAFRNVLLGDDNTGLRVAPQDEPGNQMAGADVRIVSPFESLPVAMYSQLIGEDNSSSGIPERYLGLFGIESWALTASGTLIRWHVEYANTSCKFANPGSNPDCAYRQAIFYGGYRYHGRNIGHTADSDSESVGAGFMVDRGSTSWGLRGRQTRLDRYGRVDIFNPLSGGPGMHKEIEAVWKASTDRQELSVEAGYERHDAGSLAGRSGPIGGIQWRLKL